MPIAAPVAATPRAAAPAIIFGNVNAASLPVAAPKLAAEPMAEPVPGIAETEEPLKIIGGKEGPGCAGIFFRI